MRGEIQDEGAVRVARTLPNCEMAADDCESHIRMALPKSLELSPVAATFASQLRSPRSFLPIASTSRRGTCYQSVRWQVCRWAGRARVRLPSQPRALEGGAVGPSWSSLSQPRQTAHYLTRKRAPSEPCKSVAVKPSSENNQSRAVT